MNDPGTPPRAAVLVAALPWVGLVVALLALLARGGESLPWRLDSAPAKWVIGAAAVAGLLASICLFLRVRGVRMPLLAPAGAAVLPWLTGIAGTRIEIAHAASLPWSSLFEARTFRELGTMSSAALLLGVCAAAFVAAGVERVRRQRSGSAASDGSDLRQAAAAASAVGALALVAAALALQSAAVGDAIDALLADEAAPAGVIVARAADVAAIRDTAIYPLAAAGAVAIGLGILALASARRGTGAIGAGIGLAGLVVGMPIVDEAAMAAARSNVSRGAAPAWAALRGFRPVVLDRRHARRASPVAFVTVDRRLVLPSGERHAIAADDDEAGLARLATVIERLRPRPGRRGWRGDSPPIALAVDARVPAATIRALAAAFVRANALEIGVVGFAGTRDDLRRAERLRGSGSWLAITLDYERSLDIDLAGAELPSYADEPDLLHTTVDATVGRTIELRPRPRSPEAPIHVDLTDASPEPTDRQRKRVHVSFPDGTPLERLLHVAGHLRARGFVPLLGSRVRREQPSTTTRNFVPGRGD